MLLSLLPGIPAKTQRMLQSRPVLYFDREKTWQGKQSGRPLKPWEQDLVRELNSGNLRHRANKATKLSGFGRIRNEEDATMERDIGPNTRGG